MSFKVSFPNLFQNEKNAGLSLEDWHTLSESEQILARLDFINERAVALTSSIRTTPDHQLHHVYRHTLRLIEQVNQVQKCLKEFNPSVIFEVMHLMIDIGKTVQEIKSLPVAHDLLVDVTKIHDARVRGGLKIGASKKSEWRENHEMISMEYTKILKERQQGKHIEDRHVASLIQQRLSNYHLTELTKKTVRSHIKKIKEKQAK